MVPQGRTDRGAEQPVTLALDVPWTAETYGPEVIFQWDAPPKGVAPAMYLDKAEIAVPVFDAPRALEVSTGKIRYQPEEQVAVSAALVNPTSAAMEVALVGEEIRAADTRREVAGPVPRHAAPRARGVRPGALARRVASCGGGYRRRRLCRHRDCL